MTGTQVTAATIRPAVPADRAAIERLLAESGLPTMGVAGILRGHADDFFVAEVDGPERTLVGVAGLEVCGGTALLRSVAVLPEWRSQGLGRELVRRVVCHAEARDLRALYLLTMTAEHYFPRFGFERIDRGEVPEEVAATLEFKSACPATAAAFMKRIGR
ncbi:MAG: hypothetical protein MNPFHGCM_00476 [Gemmatimonadaceae bacterium]|nr:hypothetical protein [Gemmatimonadaceae bacterium]